MIIFDCDIIMSIYPYTTVQPISIRRTPEIFDNNRLFIQKALTVRCYHSIPPYIKQTLRQKLIIRIGRSRSCCCSSSSSNSSRSIGISRGCIGGGGGGGTGNIGGIHTTTTNRSDRLKMSSVGRVRNRRPSLVEWTQHMVSF
ncbi:hypothetical protein DINM_007268 [Dirofilaria immitis]|nr:hypothetical protein [Dirofilaria immitis]